MGSGIFCFRTVSKNALVKVRYDLLLPNKNPAHSNHFTTENEDCQPKGNKLDPKERDQNLCVCVSTVHQGPCFDLQMLSYHPVRDWDVLLNP